MANIVNKPGIFEARYRRAVQSEMDSLPGDEKELSERYGDLSSLDAGVTGSEKRWGVPADIWEERLTRRQQIRRILTWSQRKLTDGKWRLAEDEYLRMAYSDLGISRVAANIAVTLFGSCLAATTNPTMDQVVEYVAQQTRAGEPLRFIMSQCIAKGEQIRPGKMNYFLDGTTTDEPIERFAKGIEAKGWELVKGLAKRVNYPVEIVLMLGDMDYFTMDGCALWANADSTERWESEMRALQSEVRERAEEFFGSNPVSVERWSDRYSVDDFSAALEKAKDREGWTDQGVFAASTDMYLEQWGYRALAARRGVDLETMEAFIAEDVVRTAAQYGLEAAIARAESAMQVWAERVPIPTWPIQLSNYDGAGYTPSIVLVK